MTGPEHYLRAAQLVDTPDDWDVTDPAQQVIVQLALAEALVHATLALAAATAPIAGDVAAWSAAAGGGR